MKSALEDKYKVTTDWEGKLYIGIALKWDYEKFMVQPSMQRYVLAELHSSQHGKKKYHRTHNNLGHNPYMEKQ